MSITIKVRPASPAPTFLRSGTEPLPVPRTTEYTFDTIEDAEREHTAGRLPDRVLARFREAFADPIADLLREGK